MARQKEFDEMTLITEESTINEPHNLDKKKEQLEQLHRQINRGQHQHESNSEFQFYPNNTEANKNKSRGVNNSGTGGASSTRHQPDGGLGNKQDSEYTETIDGQNQQQIEQASVTDQLDVSPSRFGGSVADESFHAAARANLMHQPNLAQSVQQPVLPNPSESQQEVDFQNSELPIETEPASPDDVLPIDGSANMTNTVKVIKQRSFLRNEQGSPSQIKDGDSVIKNMSAKNTSLKLQLPYDEEEDVIEQTFGVGDDQRNNQIFQDLPTPKSRMKREIDIEKDLQAAAGVAAIYNAQGNQTTQNRKKTLNDTIKRVSEHNVIDQNRNSDDKPGPITKNNLYASSQKQLDISPQDNKSGINGQKIGNGLYESPDQKQKINEESPLDVQNLTSYFDKMQVGKKASQITNTQTANASNEKKAGSRQNQSRKMQSRHKRDSEDFNNIREAAPLEPGSPEHPHGRKRGDSSSEAGILGLAGNSKQASKYQVNALGDQSNTQQQASRTGSPQKKNSLKPRDTNESLQTSNTPTLKDQTKNLALKSKLQDALQPAPSDQLQQRITNQVDPTTKKMIIGYQQLKRRKHAQSGGDQLDTFDKSERKNKDVSCHDSDTRELGSIKSSNNNLSPNRLRSNSKNNHSNLHQQPNVSSVQDESVPQSAHFQIGIVGYQNKRKQTDLEQELEASLKGQGNAEPQGANLTDAFNTRDSPNKPNRPNKNRRVMHQNTEQLEIGSAQDIGGLASDFEGNFPNEMNGTLRTRKLYSQQKRGTRKKILASALKKNKEFKEKTNTIEHMGGVSRGLESNFQIEGRRLMDQIEIDNQSGGTQGNMLNNVDDLADGFNGSNFDLQSVQGYSQNQYAMGGGYNHNTGNLNGPLYANHHNRGVLSQTGSNQAKRINQMQQYQIIKGNKQQSGYYLDEGRPLSNAQYNHFQAANGGVQYGDMGQQQMLNSIEVMRDDYLNELPKSINLQSNHINSAEIQAQKNGKAPDSQSNLHDVSFKAYKNKPIPAGKPRLETLSTSALAEICTYLKPAETIRLTMTTKKIQKKAHQPEFDSLWVLFSFQTIFSKTGFTGIKNAAQKRIDEALHQMHFQCESIRRDSKEVQVNIFEKWLAFSVIMVCIAIPVLLVASMDFGYDLSRQMLFLPVTVSWGLLMLAQLYIWYRINKYYKRVITLHLTQPQYKLDGNEKESPKKANPHARASPTTVIQITKHFFQKAVQGRNAKHCSLYTFGSFINRFCMMNMLGLSFMYLGFFLKIYVLEDSVTYLQTMPISVGPLLLMYLYELICEVIKDGANWSRKNAHISEQMARHNMVDNLSSHKRLRCKINCGLIPNYILFTSYHAGFFALLCMRLDRTIDLSFFIILIPLWIFLAYFSTFLVISGLASTNHRVNKCERITLSVFVPIGFILTLILGLMLIDEYASYPVYITFIPMVASLIFSYLYVRCLIKPTKNDFVKVKPEQQQQQQQSQSPSAFQESQQRFQQQQNSFQISQQLAKQYSMNNQSNNANGQQMPYFNSQVQVTSTNQPSAAKPVVMQHANSVPSNTGGSGANNANQIHLLQQLGQGSGGLLLSSSVGGPNLINQSQQPMNMLSMANTSNQVMNNQNSTKPPLAGGLRQSQQSNTAAQLLQQNHSQSQQQIVPNPNTSNSNLQQFQVKHAFY